jgi:hypothetical protein
LKVVAPPFTDAIARGRTLHPVDGALGAGVARIRDELAGRMTANARHSITHPFVRYRPAWATLIVVVQKFKKLVSNERKGSLQMVMM